MQKLSIDATVENLDNVLEFLDRQLDELDCPPKVQIQLDVAAEELYVNIAHYAYGNEPGTAEIVFDHDLADNSVSITFKARTAIKTIHCFPLRKILGKISPLTSCFYKVQYCINLFSPLF